MEGLPKRLVYVGAIAGLGYLAFRHLRASNITAWQQNHHTRMEEHPLVVDTSFESVQRDPLDHDRFLEEVGKLLGEASIDNRGDSVV